MKLLIFLALVAVTVAYPAETYDSKYDNINIDEVLDNQRLFDGFIQCFEGKGPCTAEAAQIKEWIPEGIQNNCAKCTEPQKKLVAKAITGTKEKYPDVYDKLMKENNPDGKHDAALADFLSKYSE